MGRIFQWFCDDACTTAHPPTQAPTSPILDFTPLPPTKPPSPPPKPFMSPSKEQTQNTASPHVGDVRFAFELDAKGPLVGDIIKRHHTNTTSAELHFLFHVRSCAASAYGATSNTSKSACKPGGSLPAWLSAALHVASTVGERVLSFSFAVFSWIARVSLLVHCLIVCLSVQPAYFSCMRLVFLGADYFFHPSVDLIR